MKAPEKGKHAAIAHYENQINGRKDIEISIENEIADNEEAHPDNHICLILLIF